MWQDLDAPEGALYTWDESSTYIHNPPFFQNTQAATVPIADIKNANVLLNVGDSITTDHISPAGKIATGSPAAVYLAGKGIKPNTTTPMVLEEEMMRSWPEVLLPT